MTDYISLLNSPDLREYLKKTGHTLSPLQKTAAVYFTDALPFSEKHALYRELIAEHPELLGQADLEALIAWEKKLCKSLFDRLSGECYNVNSVRDIPFLEINGEQFYITNEKYYSQHNKLLDALRDAVGSRSDVYCDCCGIRLITNHRGEITRILQSASDASPNEMYEALEQALCSMDLYRDEKLPDLYVPGDFLSLWDYEYDMHEYNYGMPMLLLEEIGEDGTALVLTMAEDFPPGCDRIPAYLLRRRTEEDMPPPPEALRLTSRRLRGEIDLGTFLCAYPQQVQRDCLHEDYLKKLLLEPEKS